MRTMTEDSVKVFSPGRLGSVSLARCEARSRALNHTAENKNNCDKQKTDETTKRDFGAEKPLRMGL